jgi:exosortase family protein XrtG
MGSPILFIISMLFWGFLLLVFYKEKMNFFKFIAGSVGIFTISMIFFTSHIERELTSLIINILGLIGRGTNYFEVFKENFIISMETRKGIVSILINYECSGVIEMLVYTSLVLFFPFGGIFRRVLSMVAGNIYIFIANIIRVLFIIVLTKSMGASAYYLIHTLFARILFFALMIVLYYFVFTATQLRFQTVGDIK